MLSLDVYTHAVQRIMNLNSELIIQMQMTCGLCSSQLHAEMRRRAKDQESRSRNHACKDHACRSHGYKSQGPIPHMCLHRHARAKYIPIHAEPGTKSHARSKSQGTRAKDQEPKTKSHKDYMSQGPCRSHAMDQEPRTKSQGPRDQPTILRYSGQHPTDSLKQILITQKMHALNIFFAKIPKFGRLHVLRL